MRTETFDPRALGSLPGLEWKARYVMEGYLSGVHGSPFHGPSVEFRDHREYQPGDDPRRLDWRLYARADRLYVRRYDQETNARCYLLVDTSASMGYRGARAWASKLDAARILGAAIGWMLLGQSDAVGLVAAQDGAVRYLRPSQKRGQAGLLVHELERLTAAGGPVLGDVLAHGARLAHRRSLVVVLSDFLDPAATLREGLRRLGFDGHECLCVQVLDADEIEFPFDEAAVFEDMETGFRREVAAPRVREAYRARFAEFLAEWRDAFRALEMRHVVVRTDEAPGRALNGLFARRPAAAR